MRKKSDISDVSLEAYYTSYTSLMIILLCIMLYLNSIATINPQREKLVYEAVKKRGQELTPPPPTVDVSEISRALNLAGFNFEPTQNGYTARSAATLYFTERDHQLRAEKLPEMDKLIAEVKRANVNLRIELSTRPNLDGSANLARAEEALLDSQALYRYLIDRGIKPEGVDIRNSFLSDADAPLDILTLTILPRESAA